jgi:hypothetical protein
MRTDMKLTALVAATTFLFAVPAHAELRSVQIKTLGMD